MDFTNLTVNEIAYATEQLKEFEEANLEKKKNMYINLLDNPKLSGAKEELAKEYRAVLSKEVDVDKMVIEYNQKNTILNEQRKLNENPVANMGQIFAITQLIVCILIGLISGELYDVGGFSSLMVIMTWAGLGIFVYVLVRILAEIIQILQDIKNKLN